jgi:hypothetical protein
MKLRDILKEVGFSTKSGYGFPYTRVKGTADTAMYEFSTGENDYQVWVQRAENDGFQQGWILHIAFAVLEKSPAQFPGHQPGKSRNFEKEVNDPKNVYKVMNTVVNIAKEEAARVEKMGIPVIRIEFEPTKRQVKDKSGITREDPKDTRRANLYMAYLKKEFPNSQIKSTSNKGKIWVDIL